MKKLLLMILSIFVISCSNNDKEAISFMRNVINNQKEQNTTQLYKNAKKQCSSGDIKGCLSIATMYYLGKEGLKKNDDVALKLANKTCSLNNPNGCTLSALIYLYGKKTVANYKKAFNIANKECKKNNLQSCIILAKMYENGLGRNKDLTKAQELYTKACKKHEEIACLGLTQVMNKIYKNQPVYIDGNKMWQDEPYNEEEKKAYNNSGMDLFKKLTSGDLKKLLNEKEYPKGVGKALNQKEAKKYCQNLTLAGYTDWYLPTVNELKKLYTKQENLKNILLDHFWSSNLAYPNLQNSTAIDVYMKQGSHHKAVPYSIDFVRCVRKIINPNKKIKWISPDKKACTTYGGKIIKNGCFANWYESKKICSFLNGRLPKIEELSKVVADCGGIIDDNKFINEKNENYQSCYQKKGFIKDYRNFYWSSTDHKNGENFKSILIFENGNIFHNIKTRDSYVRCIVEDKKNRSQKVKELDEAILQKVKDYNKTDNNQYITKIVKKTLKESNIEYINFKIVNSNIVNINGRKLYTIKIQGYFYQLGTTKKPFNAVIQFMKNRTPYEYGLILQSIGYDYRNGVIIFNNGNVSIYNKWTKISF